MDFGSVEAERSQIDDAPDSPRRRQPVAATRMPCAEEDIARQIYWDFHRASTARRANRPVAIRPSGRRNSHMPSGNSTAWVRVSGPMSSLAVGNLA